MNAARRDKRRRDWPRGLYEPRPGYFVWRHPKTGDTMAIGRVPFSEARGQAIAANAYVAGSGPSLVERLQGAGQSVGDLLNRMPTDAAPNTLKAWRSLDKRIRAALGSTPCAQLDTRACARLIEETAAELDDEDRPKVRTAEALRSRLIAVCQRGQQLGWLKENPAEPTARPAVEVRRGRLLLEQFQAIHARAAEVAEWLPHAMMLALVTGQDRSTVAAMERAHIGADALTVWRRKTRKTNQPVEIPLALRLDAVGVTLADLVKHRTPVVSRYLVHHVSPWGNAPAGSAVFPDRISKAFTAARALSGIPDVLPDGSSAPTFHEIRSLSKRLYDEQGGVDTKALLGHRTEKMGALYADPRGAAPIRVRVG